jgi:hypothetical protein
MKLLREIGYIFTGSPPQFEEVFYPNRSQNPTSQVELLFQGIKNGAFHEDSDAAREIFGVEHGGLKLSVLKHRLRRRLLHALLLLKMREPEYSESTRVLLECQKGLFWSTMLLRLGARSAAIKIANETLTLAKKFELTSIALSLQLQLSEHHSLTGDSRAFERVSKEIEHSIGTLIAETKALGYFRRVTIKFAATGAEQPEVAELAASYSDELEKIRKEYDTYEISLQYFRLRALSFQIVQRFEETIQICEEAESYIRSRIHLFSKARLGEFALKRLVCHLHLRDYDRGKLAVAECAERFPTGAANWFLYMEYYFLLALQTEHFQEAEEIFETVSKYPRFDLQQEQRKEKWRIFELYLRYGLHLENLKNLRSEAETPETPPQFDKRKFLRLVPTYAKDKRGFNIAVLLMHILYLLENDDFTGVINRMQALRTYRSRYLQMHSNRQSAFFFKLLLIMESTSFSYTATKIKGEKYFSQLQTSTPDYNEIFEAIQILPFDWLWLRVLEKLERYEDKNSSLYGKNKGFGSSKTSTRRVA